MKRSSLSWIAVGASFLLLGVYAVATPPAGSYHLLKKVPLGAAPGGGEYFGYLTIDSAARLPKVLPAMWSVRKCCPA